MVLRYRSDRVRETAHIVTADRIRSLDEQAILDMIMELYMTYGLFSIASDSFSAEDSIGKLEREHLGDTVTETRERAEDSIDLLQQIVCKTCRDFGNTFTLVPHGTV